MEPSSLAEARKDDLPALILPAGADLAAVLGLPRETLVANLPSRLALTIRGGRKCLGVRRG